VKGTGGGKLQSKYRKRTSQSGAEHKIPRVYYYVARKKKKDPEWGEATQMRKRGGRGLENQPGKKPREPRRQKNVKKKTP